MGAFGAASSIRLSFAFIAALAALVILLLDFQKTVYALACFLVLDYGFRQVLQSAFLGSVWDELFFIFCAGLLLYKWVVFRKEKAYRWTPLEFPIFLFIAVGIILLLINAPDMRIGIEGLRVVIQYILWYFVATQLLRTKTGARNVLYVLILIGTALGLHGIYQYVANVPMPANWIDSLEAGLRTRAFSIVGSPNILGSLMVLLVPVSIGFAFFEKKLMKKLLFAGVALIMTGCLVVTHSRGAELSFILAALVYIALLRDKRIILPSVLVLALGLVLIIVAVPSVLDRMIYMLSPEYLASSMRGGRMIRWLTGLEMLKGNPWLGLGLGQFGGAVAVNNNIPGAFYMDNYFLKTAVEMGIVGLAAFVGLVACTLTWNLRALRRVRNSRFYYLVHGTFAGMCGVIAHNFVENVFEVPMMVTYFWLFAGVNIFLAYIAEDNAVPSGCEAGNGGETAANNSLTGNSETDQNPVTEQE